MTVGECKRFFCRQGFASCRGEAGNARYGWGTAVNRMAASDRSFSRSGHSDARQLAPRRMRERAFEPVVDLIRWAEAHPTLLKRDGGLKPTLHVLLSYTNGH